MRSKTKSKLGDKTLIEGGGRVVLNKPQVTFLHNSKLKFKMQKYIFTKFTKNL